MNTLRHLLAAVGEPLVEVLAAPAGLDVPVTGLAIVDPDDEPDEHRGSLVLIVGARGHDAARLVRAAAGAGASAAAVKVADAGRALRETALEAGIALLAVPSDVRWERLESLAAGVLDAGESAGPDDLFALAQTVALLTHGIVCVEDTASRVLAYSRSDGDDAQIDELRRLSILGWQGPADYLHHLREWGVFDRLRAGEEVVHIDEHAELGVRRRLAIGIHAGPRPLGAIWVQEGAQPFSPRAEDVLVGAARVAAGHLVRRRRSAPTWHRDLVEGLLDGRASPDLVAGTFGLDEHAPALVVGFAVRAGEGVTRELSVAELADLVAVHAAGYRRAALTAWRGDAVYAVLPDVSDSTDPALRAMCAEVVAVTRRRTGVRVQAGIGGASGGLAGVPGSRADADRVLAAMPGDGEVAV
ncbi:MAG: PucR family transcriptional regulator, partial [Pseudonocardiales bacterium]|nr:PucR family transcriptional regulator [Pseudonocardiales bacterium]